MALTDLTTFTPDANRYGECVARTNRILAKLLLDWTKAEEAGDKRRPQFLTAIYFDKLAEFFCRIWDQLRKDGKVRFRSAYKSFRGIHGPGRGMAIDRKKDEEESLGKDPHDYRRHKVAYITEIVEKLGPPIGRARNLFELSGAPPWSYLCRVSSQLAQNQWESWLDDPDIEGVEYAFLAPRELDLVFKISEIIGKLTKYELRVLGTHSYASQTIKAIQFNINQWEDRFDTLLDLLQQGPLNRSITAAGESLLYVAHELGKKSVTNRRYYEKALEKVVKVLATIQDKDLEQAIRKVQVQNAAEIWGDDTVKRYAEHVNDIVALSECLRGYAEIVGFAGIVNDKKRKETAQVVETLIELGSSLGLSLSAPSGVKVEDRKDFADACESIKEVIWKYLPPVPRPRKTGVP